METNLAYGLRSEHELQENPVEQVVESTHHLNSDPQQSPSLLEYDSELSNGYRDIRPVDTTGYADVLCRQSSYETSV